MMENNLSIDNINHYDSVTTDILLQCVNKNVLNNKYIDRETLLKYIDELPNIELIIKITIVIRNFFWNIRFM